MSFLTLDFLQLMHCLLLCRRNALRGINMQDTVISGSENDYKAAALSHRLTMHSH